MVWFKRSDSRLTMLTGCFRHPRGTNAPVHRTSHGRQRLAKFMGDGGREPAQGRHAPFVATSCSSLRSSVRS